MSAGKPSAARHDYFTHVEDILDGVQKAKPQTESG